MEQSSPVERACNDSLQSTQKARTWIRNGWIAALFSAFVTLLLALAGATGTPGLNYNLWNLLDVFLMTVLAFGIYQRSRVAATSMFVYFLVSKIGQWVHSANVIGIGGSLVFVYLYLQAMRGTFRLSPPLKVNRPLAFSLLLAFLSLSLALVNGPVWREGQSKKVPPLSWEEFVATDLYKELSPEKKAEAQVHLRLGHFRPQAHDLAVMLLGGGIVARLHGGGSRSGMAGDYVFRFLRQQADGCKQDQAAHLLRRMGFGGNEDDRNALVAKGSEKPLLIICSITAALTTAKWTT